MEFDKRHASLTEPPRSELYIPWNQSGRASGWVVIRTDGDSLALVPGVRDVLKGLDPTIALTSLGRLLRGWVVPAHCSASLRFLEPVRMTRDAPGGARLTSCAVRR